MANVPISAFTVPANTVGIGVTGYSLTGSASASFMDLAGTWNTSGTPTAIKLNITNTASAAASLLMDLQVGGTSAFTVSRAGALKLANQANITSSGAELIFNNGFSASLIFGLGNSAAQVKCPGSLGLTLGAGTGGAVALSTTLDSSAFLFQMTVPAAANLRFGAADAATPVAQTLSVQSVVTGTSNTAGTNFTITGSQGTGTGAGGSLIFQVAPAGSSGSAVNALATALTIDSNRYVTLGSGGGLYSGSGNSLYLGNALTFGGAFRLQDTVGVAIPSNLSYRWSSDTTSFGTADVTLFRDDANKLALRNGTNAQEFRVYETTTGTIYKAILGNRQLMKIAGAAFDNGAGASAGTLANAPAAGNPTKWIPIDDNGTTRYIPAW